MTIAAGEKLPDATFKTITPDGAKDLTTADIFAGKKVVMFGVPGAFTPTCSNNHLPGYAATTTCRATSRTTTRCWRAAWTRSPCSPPTTIT